MSNQKKKFKMMFKRLDLLKRNNGERKQKHGEKRNINPVRAECLLVENLLFLLLCKRSKKLEKVLESENLSKDMETFRKISQ